ncbi:MAG: LysR family transcriptional regulator [Clostridiales bacterium]|nr:LysR family transcriptional regulator [Clostridiales bacterium]
MNIRQLRYFIEICETRSFSKAAERLYISQQGLSMAIMRLEQELSCSLFDRKPNGLQLTKGSEYLLPKAIKIVKDIEGCEAYFQKMNKDDSTLKLCGTPGAFIEYAGALLSDFQEENPHYEIKAHECSDLMCDKAVETGEAELSFTAGPFDEQMFEGELMLKSRFFLLVHTDHPLAEKASIRLDSLKTITLAVTFDGTKAYSEIAKYFEPEGPAPVIQHLAATPGFVRHAVVNGAAALILRPENYQVDRFGYLKAIPVEDSRVCWASHMIKKRGAVLSEGAYELEKYFLKHKPAQKSRRGHC